MNLVNGLKPSEKRNIMKKLIFILGIISIFAFASVGMAVPTLQLDIGDGWYDQPSESVVTASGNFTLYALLTLNGEDATHLSDPSSLINDHYFLSISVYDSLGDGATISGDDSFALNGTNYSVSTDFIYGVPPIEGGTATQDGGDLPGHGVFPTQFMEYEFQFSAADSTGTYNVQDDPGTFGTHTGNDTYFVAFNFTGTDLDGDYNLHFDLYNTQLKTKDDLADIDAYLFAPFSHDAQRVPEPGTLVLLGIGILGVAVYRRKMS